MVATAVTDRAKHEGGVLNAGVVGAWVVVGLLGLGIAINVMVLAATTTSNAMVQVPVRLVAGEGAVPWAGGEVSLDALGSELTVLNADPTSALLARADVWSPLLLGGVAVLLLVPAVRSVVAGRPFARGNARLLAAATGVAALGWISAALLPMIAAQRLLATHPVGASTATYGPAFRPSYWPLGVLALLLALALAVRQGERVAADTEGLV